MKWTPEGQIYVYTYMHRFDTLAVKHDESGQGGRIHFF